MQSEDDLGTQPASKEKERNKHQDVRFCQLQSSLKQAKEENSYLSECYQQLREDFEYNLAILDERDRELERYDVISARAVTAEQSRLKELKQLRMQVAKLEEQSATDIPEDRKEVLSKSQHNNAHHRLQLDELKRSMACEMEKQTAECKRTKLNLQGQLTLQRQEMTAAFDSVLRQWEHQFNLKIDEINAMMVSLNLKMKQLSKKTDIYYQAQATEALKASEELTLQLQTQLHHKDQEIRTLTALNDKRYEDLVQAQKKYDAQLEAQHQSHTRELHKAEEHIAKFHKSMEVLAAQVCSLQEDQQEAMKQKEETIQRYEDLVRAQKKYDARLEAQHQSHTRELQKAEKHFAKLHKRIEDQQKAMKQKDETIQRLRTEVETTQSGWDNYFGHVSREMVGKNTEMITLQTRERELQTELERRQDEIEGYKQQVSAGLKREKTLQQMRVQAELESQRHLEDIKAKHHLDNKQLKEDLTQARDQYVTLKRDFLASEEKLQEQINILRAVVTQITKAMETSSNLLPIHQAKPQAVSPQCPGPRSSTSITPTAHMTTRPPDQFTHSFSKFSPAGVLHLEEHSKPSPVTEQELRVEHKESAGLNTLVRQLQKENLHLRRQLASDDPPYIHARLKQAAFHIARLCREKQQLIEMGNRLGSELISAGLNEPEKLEDLSTKEEGDQHLADNRLSVLEQLQYKLTTQELQHCLRQRAAEEVLPETKHQGVSSNSAVNPWSSSRNTTDRSESLKNEHNARLICQPQSSLTTGPQPLSGLPGCELSSGESLQSLKDLWEMLEPGHSSAIFSEGELSRMEVAESDSTGVQMIVNGIGVPIHSRPATEVQQRMSLYKLPSNTTKTSSSGTPGRIIKIRNYNVKD